MSKRRRAGRDVPELLTLAFSLAIVAALVGGVVYVQVARGDRPPAIDASASLDATRAEGGRFYVPIEIENTGDQAAEAVLIVVVQRVADRDVEHELLIDHLAGHGKAEATTVLTADPRAAPVRVEVRSFQRR